MTFSYTAKWRKLVGPSPVCRTKSCRKEFTSMTTQDPPCLAFASGTTPPPPPESWSLIISRKLPVNYPFYLQSHDDYCLSSINIPVEALNEYLKLPCTRKETITWVNEWPQLSWHCRSFRKIFKNLIESCVSCIFSNIYLWLCPHKSMIHDRNAAWISCNVSSCRYFKYLGTCDPAACYKFVPKNKVTSDWTVIGIKHSSEWMECTSPYLRTFYYSNCYN